MTGKKLIHGYFDKLARNIQALDAGIESVRKPVKGEKPTDRRARLKLLRDLVELQNASMATVKAHILGRDETGTVNEPEDHYDEYALWEFERDFKQHLEPWTQKDIEFECEDCGVESEKVTRYTFPHPYPQDDEHFYLCQKCYEKRAAQQPSQKDAFTEADLRQDAESDAAGAVAEPASKREIEALLQSARLMILLHQSGPFLTSNLATLA